MSSKNQTFSSRPLILYIQYILYTYICIEKTSRKDNRNFNCFRELPIERDSLTTFKISILYCKLSWRKCCRRFLYPSDRRAHPGFLRMPAITLLLLNLNQYCLLWEFKCPQIKLIAMIQKPKTNHNKHNISS